MSQWQNNFIRLMQGDISPVDPRWQVYADAYYGRLAKALSESLLDRVSYLFGESFIQSILCTYIRAQPPQHPIMLEILRGLADFMRSQGWAETHPELVEMVAMSVVRWDILIGEDPKPSLQWEENTLANMDDLRLQSNHALIASDLPIFDLWRAADPDAVNCGDQRIDMQAQALLFFKSSPVVLECVMIPVGLVSWAEGLSRGLQLDLALQIFLEGGPGEADLKKLPDLISTLIRRGALIRSN